MFNVTRLPQNNILLAGTGAYSCTGPVVRASKSGLVELTWAPKTKSGPVYYSLHPKSKHL